MFSSAHIFSLFFTCCTSIKYKAILQHQNPPPSRVSTEPFSAPETPQKQARNKSKDKRAEMKEQPTQKFGAGYFLIGVIGGIGIIGVIYIFASGVPQRFAGGAMPITPIILIRLLPLHTHHTFPLSISPFHPDLSTTNLY